MKNSLKTSHDKNEKKIQYFSLLASLKSEKNFSAIVDAVEHIVKFARDYEKNPEKNV